MQETKTTKSNTIIISFDEKLIEASLDKMRARAKEDSEQQGSSPNLIYNSYRAIN